RVLSALSRLLTTFTVPLPAQSHERYSDTRRNINKGSHPSQLDLRLIGGQGTCTVLPWAGQHIG
ncbi:MAG TPA: hypothetical protein VOA64_19705, partial [Candidatus Dormibacteraeota bacterium]|nr:hypothetical protein [Candidatus Dormibacteraeota bacterium]